MIVKRIPPPKPIEPPSTYNIEGLTHTELRVIGYALGKLGAKDDADLGTKPNETYALFDKIDDAVRGR